VGDARWASVVEDKDWVLLVEDNDMLRQSLENLLGDQGYAVMALASAETAIEAVQADLEHLPAMVISDNNLGPNSMRGFQLLSWFEQEHPGIRRILMSGDTPDLLLPSAQRFILKGPRVVEIILKEVAAVIA
jgi:DNA-binding NtrC family response regulator